MGDDAASMDEELAGMVALQQPPVQREKTPAAAPGRPVRPHTPPPDQLLASRRLMTPSRMWFVDLKENWRGWYLKVREARNRETQQHSLTPEGIRPVVLVPAAKMRKMREAIGELVDVGREDQKAYHAENPDAARYATLQNQLNKEVDEEKKAALKTEWEALHEQLSASKDEGERTATRIAERQVNHVGKVFYLDLFRRRSGAHFLRIKESTFVRGDEETKTGGEAPEGPPQSSSVVIPFGKAIELHGILEEMIPLFDEKFIEKGRQRGDPQEMKASEDKRLVFIGNIPWAFREEDISRIVEGSVDPAQIQRVTRLTKAGRSLGCALISLANSEAADKVISSLDGMEVDGRPLRARLDMCYNPEVTPRSVEDSQSRLPQPNRLRYEFNVDKTVFVRNLNFTTRWKELKEHVESNAGLKVNRVEIFYQKDGRSRGMARVELQDESMVQDAVGMLNDKLLDGRPLVIRPDQLQSKTRTRSAEVEDESVPTPA